MVLISWILPDDPGGITCMCIDMYSKINLKQGHSIERTTHSMEIGHEILTMHYAHFTCPLSRSSRYCLHFEIR